MLHLIFLIISIFISTNLDDFALLLLLSEEVVNKRLQIHQIVLGQWLGMVLILGVSLSVSFGLKLLPLNLTHYLGIVPIMIGARMFWQNNKQTTPQKVKVYRQSSWRQIFMVAGLTLAGGGDNLAIYIPFF